MAYPQFELKLIHQYAPTTVIKIEVPTLGSYADETAVAEYLRTLIKAEGWPEVQITRSALVVEVVPDPDEPVNPEPDPSPEPEPEPDPGTDLPPTLPGEPETP